MYCCFSFHGSQCNDRPGRVLSCSLSPLEVLKAAVFQLLFLAKSSDTTRFPSSIKPGLIYFFYQILSFVLQSLWLAARPPCQEVPVIHTAHVQGCSGC